MVNCNNLLSKSTIYHDPIDGFNPEHYKFKLYSKIILEYG